MKAISLCLGGNNRELQRSSLWAWMNANHTPLSMCLPGFLCDHLSSDIPITRINVPLFGIILNLFEIVYLLSHLMHCNYSYCLKKKTKLKPSLEMSTCQCDIAGTWWTFAEIIIVFIMILTSICQVWETVYANILNHHCGVIILSYNPFLSPQVLFWWNWNSSILPGGNGASYGHIIGMKHKNILIYFYDWLYASQQS